jgi:hypothetical protein
MGRSRVGKGGPNLPLRHGVRAAVPTRPVPQLRVGTAELKVTPNRKRLGRLCPPYGRAMVSPLS